MQAKGGPAKVNRVVWRLCCRPATPTPSPIRVVFRWGSATAFSWPTRKRLPLLAFAARIVGSGGGACRVTWPASSWGTGWTGDGWSWRRRCCCCFRLLLLTFSGGDGTWATLMDPFPWQRRRRGGFEPRLTSRVRCLNLSPEKK